MEIKKYKRVTIEYNRFGKKTFEGEYKNLGQFNGKLKTYFDDINHILKREVEKKMEKQKVMEKNIIKICRHI